MSQANRLLHSPCPGNGDIDTARRILNTILLGDGENNLLDGPGGVVLPFGRRGRALLPQPERRPCRLVVRYPLTSILIGLFYPFRY